MVKPGDADKCPSGASATTEPPLEPPTPSTPPPSPPPLSSATAIMPLASVTTRDSDDNNVSSNTRNRMSDLLSRQYHQVASGNYVCGGTLDSKTWPFLPRIKHKSMPTSLQLPLASGEVNRLKKAQTKAGQGRDCNVDGEEETRLPWAIRPELDFKIVNYKVWASNVVTPLVKKVRLTIARSGVDWPIAVSCCLQYSCTAQ